MTNKLGIALLIFTVGNFAFSINVINNKTQEISYWKDEAKQYFREKEDTKTELEGLIEAIALDKNTAIKPLKLYVLSNTTYGKCITANAQNGLPGYCGNNVVNGIYVDLLKPQAGENKFLVPGIDKLLKTKSSLDLLKKISAIAAINQ